MAEHESGQERTERATPRRQQEARDKGLVARSRELNTVALLLVVAAPVSSVALGGIHFSAKAVSLQWERISPMKGFARIFSAQGLMELVKSLIKFLLVGGP